jgi:hypothetical protein
MELREFITATLTEIQLGVQNAIDSAAKSHTKGAINPCWGVPQSKHIEKVQFDIAVTVSDKREGSAEAGIKVVGISLGGDKSKSSETSHVSRIQFSIPIIPPVTNIT